MSKGQTQWIAGINAVASALEHDPDSVVEVLVEAGGRNPRLTEIEEKARRCEVDVRRVAVQALDGAAGGVRHQGVVARYRGPTARDEDDLPELIAAAEGRALLLVLDGITDPHNLGACLRSAAAAGVTAVVIPKDRSAPLNATVRKTSSGAADRVPVIRATNLARCLSGLRDFGVWVYGLDGESRTSLYSLDLAGSIALVVGAEGEGLRRLTRERCDGLAQIPMPGAMESLNVSVAAGVALFEAVRQRSASSTG
ncbi:MAG TPA: 23S rRNA (guanosine(2251)-2'-O)-methyltransferase RlmB [Xanthomonadales bacterium]|nr:23S rRNA (guanosine(2251)-2'-O)-methyltransferase RlmB [Xanthomonadales bacterium]